MDGPGVAGDTSSPVSMHLLPCSIAHTGPANVDAYFAATDTGHVTDGKRVLEAAFRGRQLRGAELELPCGYTGFVLESASGQAQAAAPEVQPAQREMGRFHSLTYWNHDTDPVSTDSVQRAVAWLPLAAQVHQPVGAHEVEAMLQERERDKLARTGA